MKGTKFNIFQKILIILLLSIIHYSLSITPSFAQNEVPDYEFQYEKYREEYNAYMAARNKYLEYETLTSKNETVAATKKLLIRRAQVLRTYFILLKKRLNTTPSVVVEEQNRLSGYLDKEIGWLEDHIEEIEKMENPTLSQLIEVSRRLERKNLDYRSKAYQGVTSILLGKARATHGEQTTINILLEEKVNENFKNSSTSGSLKNWVDEAKNNAYWGGQAIERAEMFLTQFDNYRNSQEELVKILGKVQAELETGKRLFQKGLGFQKEIISAIEGGN